METGRCGLRGTGLPRSKWAGGAEPDRRVPLTPPPYCAPSEILPRTTVIQSRLIEPVDANGTVDKTLADSPTHHPRIARPWFPFDQESYPASGFAPTSAAPNQRRVPGKPHPPPTNRVHVAAQRTSGSVFRALHFTAHWTDQFGDTFREAAQSARARYHAGRHLSDIGSDVPARCAAFRTRPPTDSAASRLTANEIHLF